MNPRTGKGAMYWIFMGAGGAFMALLVAQFVPSIVPARAASVRL